MKQQSVRDQDIGSRFTLVGAVVVGLLITVIFVLIYLSVGHLSQTEANLFSVVLTLVSIGFGWAVSHHYSQKSFSEALDRAKEEYQSNLRTYALKAAEKVNNLSQQL